MCGLITACRVNFTADRARWGAAEREPRRADRGAAQKSSLPHRAPVPPSRPRDARGRAPYKAKQRDPRLRRRDPIPTFIHNTHLPLSSVAPSGSCSSPPRSLAFFSSIWLRPPAGSVWTTSRIPFPRPAVRVRRLLPYPITHDMRHRSSSLRKVPYIPRRG